VAVRPLTRVTLEQLQSQGPESAELYLQTGRVRVEVRPPAGGAVNFTVRSPSATASVRGTSFEFDGVNLHVDEGRVYIVGSDSSAVYVGAGHQAVSDSRTGKIAGAAEMVMAELTPAISEAAAESMTAPTAQDIVTQNNSDLGVLWE
jgi:hypothetical protein